MTATTLTIEPPPSTPAPSAARLLSLETPYGKPLSWAEVAVVTDTGDSHSLNDDRCLVITSKDLGERVPLPLREFVLCVLADGATGSTFSPAAGARSGNEPRQHAGWRASQLAQPASCQPARSLCRRVWACSLQTG